jgi:hypothetical protein
LSFSDVNHQNFFEVIGPEVQENKKFGLKTFDYLIKWKEVEKSPDVDETVLAAMQQVLDPVYAAGVPKDLINAKIVYPVIDEPILCPFVPTKELIPLRLLCKLEFRQVKFEGELRLQIQHISMPDKK